MDAGFISAAEACTRFSWVSTTYAGHENGLRGFRKDTAAEYAKAFKVAPEWLLYGRANSLVLPERDERMVDVYDVRASAGHGAIVDGEYVVDRLSFPPDFLSRLTRTSPKNLAIISVKGESMTPTLADDDLVMIDKTKTSLDFDGLFVLKFGDALHIKRVGRGCNGTVVIISDNLAYPSRDMPRQEIDVVGKVIWLGKKA